MATIAIDQRLSQIPVEQAVFASHNNARVRGYQIAARSAGINGQIAHNLVKWSPSHGGLVSQDTNAVGLCYFRIGQKRLAIGRSVYGTPEFSGRGGLQTVTIYIVSTTEHMAGFDNNAWQFSLLARSEGWLRYNPLVRNELPTIDMQASWQFGRLVARNIARPPGSNPKNEVAERALLQLKKDRRVAVIGLADPIPTLRKILASLSPEQRLDMTFSLGIQPSVERPFRLQFLEQADVKTRSELSADRVSVIPAQPLD